MNEEILAPGFKEEPFWWEAAPIVARPARYSPQAR